MLIGTWNMEGGTNSGESKWGRAFSLFSSCDVFCLQECGTARNLYGENDKGGIRTGFRSEGSTKWFLAFAVWGTGTDGSRCNSAIVVKISAERYKAEKAYETDLILPPNDANFQRRRAMLRVNLGSELGQLNAFCVHGPASGGAKDYAENMMSKCSASYMNNFWAGDFNCDPDELKSKKWVVEPPVAATYSARVKTADKMKDYLVVSNGMKAVAKSVITDNIAAYSDHYPAMFELPMLTWKGA
jgi:endonuclease/exonuclease/phosphatase family metal-dependent hydrolase